MDFTKKKAVLAADAEPLRSRSRSRKSKKSSRYRSRSGSARRNRSRYSGSRSYSRSRSGSYSPSYRRSRRSHSRSPMSNRRRHKGSRDNPQPSRCLGVFGLSLSTTEQQLRHIFDKYGLVDTVQVIIDAKTGRSRGFGFVYFVNYEDAQVAKEHCTGLEIDGRQLRVDFSITDRAHTPTPGIYMGKPTYNDEHHSRDRGRGRDRGYDDYYGGGGGGGYRGGGRYRSPSPYYSSRRRSRYDRSRSRSYSPRRY